MAIKLKRALVVLLTSVAVSGTVFVGLREESNQTCAPILSIEKSRTLIASLDRLAPTLSSTTIDVIGRSTEGGSQTTYIEGKSKSVIEQQFYGETGRATIRVYYNDNTIFAITKWNTSYIGPINVDPNAAVANTEEKSFYLDQNENVCYMSLNGIPTPVDSDTQEMIADYIAGIE